MTADLRSDHVWLADEAEASRLYNKGAFGQPQSGGALRLDLLEACHLVEEAKLQVQSEGGSVGLSDLLALGACLDRGFETRWLAFRDLRRRGYVVKASSRPGLDFQVYPRGGFPGTTPASTHLLALSESGTFELERLFAEARAAAEHGKVLWLAVVDEEGDLTYYHCAERDPTGGVPRSVSDLKGLVAEVLPDRAILWDPEAARTLHAEEFLGRPLDHALQLSLVEAVWLAQTYGLELRDAVAKRLVPAKELAERAGRTQRDFDLRLSAYAALRRRGLAVKTGFKYGTHFRAYAEDPEKAHAEFLVHALPESFTAPWPDIAGVVRLSHSVRKTLLFVSGGRVLGLERARP